MTALTWTTCLPDFARLATFAVAALALNVTPGADMTFVAATAARGGARSGVVAALGVGAGSLIHLSAAVVGLSAIIASSPAAFGILKWAGAGYLLYTAWTLLRTGAAPTQAAVPSRSLQAVFRAGALVNVLNPKVGLFFLAFLPQFVDADPASVAVQTLLLGLSFNASGTIVNIAVAFAAARATAALGGLKWVARGARWLAATIMGALAVKLVAS